MPEPNIDQEYEYEDYAGHEVYEYLDTPVPTWLKWVYVIMPIWGIIWFAFLWDGSTGWMDRGHWEQLEAAANTRMVKNPFEPTPKGTYGDEPPTQALDPKDSGN